MLFKERLPKLLVVGVAAVASSAVVVGFGARVGFDELAVVVMYRHLYSDGSQHNSANESHLSFRGSQSELTGKSCGVVVVDVVVLVSVVIVTVELELVVVVDIAVVVARLIVVAAGGSVKPSQSTIPSLQVCEPSSRNLSQTRSPAVT